MSTGERNTMKNLTQGNIVKNFFLFSAPLVLAGLFSQTYNIVDTAIAGRFLGEEGLAAIGATSGYSTLFSSLFIGLSSGFSVYVARCFGMGDYVRIKRGIRTYLTLCLGAGLLITLLTFLFLNPIFNLLQIKQEIRSAATTYFLITFGISSLSYVSVACVFTLNALGISSFTFWMSLLSGVINVAGNLLTVAWLGWNVEGLALSTALATVTVTVLYYARLNKCFTEMGVQNEKTGLELSEIKNAMPYMLPIMVQQLFIYLAGIVISPILNATGTAAIASYVVANQLLTVNNTTYQNSFRAVSNYGAQCMGSSEPVEKKRKMLKQGLLWGVAQGFFFISFTLLPCILFPNLVVSVFMKEDAGAQAYELALLFVRVFLPFILFNVINSLFHAHFRGVKNMKYLLISTVLGSVARIAASVPLTLSLGIKGFYIGLVVGWVIEPLFLLILCLLGKWLPKELRPQKKKKPLPTAE